MCGLALYIFCVLEKGGRNNWVFFQCTLQGMNKETWMLIKGNKKTSLKRGASLTYTAKVVATENILWSVAAAQAAGGVHSKIV